MNLLDTSYYIFAIAIDSKDLIHKSYTRARKEDLKVGEKYLIENDNNEIIFEDDKKSILINIGADNLFIFKNIKTNDIYNIYYHNLSGFFEYADGTKISVTKISWKIRNLEEYPIINEITPALNSDFTFNKNGKFVRIN